MIWSRYHGSIWIKELRTKFYVPSVVQHSWETYDEMKLSSTWSLSGYNKYDSSELKMSENIVLCFATEVLRLFNTTACFTLSFSSRIIEAEWVSRIKIIFTAMLCIPFLKLLLRSQKYIEYLHKWQIIRSLSFGVYNMSIT